MMSDVESMESLQSILSDDVPQAPVATGEQAAPPAAGDVEVEQTEAPSQARDESGKFTKAESQEPAKAEAPAKAEEPRKTTPADVPAIIEERRKRQELQRQLEALQKQQPQRVPSVLEDEDAAFNARLNQGTGELKELFYQQSLEIAQLRYGEKMPEAQAAFLDAAEADPSLYDGLRAARNPGEYIYKVGMFHKELKPYGGDIFTWKNNLSQSYESTVKEKDARIAALELQLAEAAKAKEQLESLPTSLNRKSTSAPKVSATEDEDIKSLTRFGKSQH